MPVVNPSEFCNQFRDELIADLELSPSIVCPKCCITYVGEYEDCCHYERREDVSDAEDSEEDSDDEIITAEVLEKKYMLVCVFDYYDTDMKEVIDEWVEKVLKLCHAAGGDALQQKWKQKISAARYI